MNMPGVGVACFIFREDGSFLVMQRMGSHGNGSWSIPGGHLEPGESWEECAAREVMEETGLIVKNIRFLAVTNDIFKDEDKHYISIWMQSDYAGGEPMLVEPEKSADMAWRTFKTLPDNLFEPCWTNLRAAKPDLFV